MSSSVEQDLPGEVLDQIVTRLRSGESLSIEGLRAEFPDYQQALQEIFPAMQLMEEIKPGRESARGPESGVRLSESIGDYVLLRELGRGGMGIVYEAWQTSLRRHVAFKIMSPELTGSASAVERFKREAQAAAQLHHTSIVPVFDVGQDQSRHFYTMQLIQGHGLDQIILGARRAAASKSGSTQLHVTSESPTNVKRQPGTVVARDRTVTNDADHRSDMSFETGGMSLQAADAASAVDPDPGDPDWQTPEFFRKAARIGLQLAEALSYAHSRGTLHRDVKPSNVLVDDSGNSFLTDFGLARIAIDESGAGAVTKSGELLGTLRYMAPERLQGNHSAAGDLYSLGVTLFELTTLRSLFTASDRLELLGKIAAGQKPAIRTLAPRMPRDLAIIITKAIDVQPEHRYSSASAMADDLRLFLLERPIRSRPVYFWEQVVRWCVRNPGTSSLLGVIAGLILVLGFGHFVFSNLRQEHATVLQLLERTEAAENESLTLARLREFAAYRQTGLAGLREYQSLLDTDPESLPDGVREILRNELLSGLSRADWSTSRAFSCPGEIGALDSENQWLAWVSGTEEVSLRHTESGELRKISGLGFTPKRLQFSGRFLIAGIPGYFWHVIDTTTGSTIHPLPQSAVDCTASDSAEVLVLAFPDFSISVQSLRKDETGRELWRYVHSSAVQKAQINPSGSRIAIQDGSGTGRLSVLELATSQLLLDSDNSGGLVVEWSPDGRFLASSDTSCEIAIWNVDEQRIVTTLRGHASMVSDIAWHPSSACLASSSWDGQKHIWNVWSGASLVHGYEPISELCFDSRGTRIGWTHSNSQLSMTEWTPGLVTDLPFDTYDGAVSPDAISVHPEGRLLAVRSSSGLQLIDLIGARACGRYPLSRCLAVAFSPSGDQLLAVTPDAVHRFPLISGLKNGMATVTIGHPLTVAHPLLAEAIFSPDRSAIWGIPVHNPGELAEYAIDDGRWVRRLGDALPGQRPEEASANLKVLCGWHSRSVTLFNSAGSPLKTLEVPEATSCAAAKDGSAVTLADGRQLQFLSGSTWEVEWQVPMDSPVVGARVAFDDASDLIACRLMTNRLAIASRTSRTVVARIDELADAWVWNTVFSPDGTRLIEACHNPHRVRVWNFAELKQRLRERSLEWETAVADSEPIRAQPAPVVQFQTLWTAGSVASNLEAHRVSALSRAEQRWAAFPDDASSMNSLAWSLSVAPLHLRNPEKALALARRCCELQPGFPGYRNTLALACLRQGLLEEAEFLLHQNLRESTPDQLTLDLLLLAIVVAQQGHFDNAMAWQRLAMLNCREHPPISVADHQDACQLLTELRELRSSSNLQE